MNHEKKSNWVELADGRKLFFFERFSGLAKRPTDLKLHLSWRIYHKNKKVNESFFIFKWEGKMYMAQIVGFKANKAYKWSFRLYISRAEAQLGIARFT